MRVFEFKRLPYSGAKEVATYTANFLTDPNTREPYFYFANGGIDTLPLDEARRLARKILAMPTPLGFKDLPDV